MRLSLLLRTDAMHFGTACLRTYKPVWVSLPARLMGRSTIQVMNQKGRKILKLVGRDEERFVPG